MLVVYIREIMLELGTVLIIQGNDTDKLTIILYEFSFYALSFMYGFTNDHIGHGYLSAKS